MSPIKPENKKLYPPNWDDIAWLIKEKAGWKCELCQSEHGKPQIVTKAIVVLTVHHINGNPEDMRRVNLLALCQRCHNKLDQPFRRKARDERAQAMIDTIKGAWKL
jgi:5-methylcytosine-specific restriction endonuclease McrA